jgi:hypothetical protein
MPLKLYLVGPIRGLSYKGATDWRTRWTEALMEMGYHIASPMRGKEILKGEKRIKESYEDLPMSSSKGIYGRDCFDVSQCEVLVANLLHAKEASIGSVMEIQRGRDLAKYVLVVMEKGSVHDHPFVREAASLVVHSEEEAFEVLRHLIAPYHDGG